MDARRTREGSALATATVDEVQLLKTLRWWDGFVIALIGIPAPTPATPAVV